MQAIYKNFIFCVLDLNRAWGWVYGRMRAVHADADQYFLPQPVNLSDRDRDPSAETELSLRVVVGVQDFWHCDWASIGGEFWS